MPIDVNRAKELFLAVLEMPAIERAAYLDTACGGDTELRQRVEAMLQTHEHSGELLPRAAAEMLADGSTEADATAAFVPQIESSGTMIEGQHGADEVLSFLESTQKSGSLGRLGHYEVLQIIGRGGFGVVLKGFDERLHRVVAIKVLSPAYAANGAARKRFIREARTAAAVKNEHVVGIHDVQEEAQPPYLVMEMIDGVSLQDKIDKNGSLGLKEILRIGMQTAEGLAAAQRQGLVHRDIKPANILLENGVERVKITDFGLARAVDDASVTQSGTVAGTPMYMSPEQAEGLPIDHRSDLFSLGTVVYAMCTGHPPFRASGTHAVLKRVIDASPRPIREINNEVPEWLCDIIAKLHAKKPEDRYQSAKEVADLLGARLADVQAGRAIDQRAEPRKAPVEAPAPALLQGAPSMWPTTLAGIVLGIAFGLATGLTDPDTFWVWGGAPLWLGVIYSAGMGAAVGFLFGFMRLLIFARISMEIRNAGKQAAPAPAAPRSGWRVAALAMGVVGVFFIVSALMLFNLPANRVSPPGIQWLLAALGLAAFIVCVFLAFPPRCWRRGLLIVLFLGVGMTTSALVTKLLHGLLVDQPATVTLSGPFNFMALEKVVIRSVETVDGQIKPDGKHSAELVQEPAFLQERIKSQATLPAGKYEVEVITKPGYRVGSCEITRDRPGMNLLTENVKKMIIDMDAGDRVTIQIAFEKAEAEPGWVQLFNGRDLTGWGWNPLRDDSWHVEAGILVSNGAQPRSLLMTLRDDFENFHLRLEIKSSAKVVNFINFRMQDDDSGYQSGIHPSAPGTGLSAGFGVTGAGLSVGKRTEVPDLPAIPPDTWFVFEIIANGPNVAYKLNGKPLVQEEGLTVRRGRIGLTVIGPIPGTVVSYKKIEIKELPASEPGWVRLFNGKDLTGWHQAEVHHHGEWTVAGGVLTGKTETGRLNVLYSDRVDFENFHLRTEVRTENSHGDLFFRTSPDVNIQGYSVAVTGFESPLRTGAVSVWTKNPLRFLPVLPGAPKRADRWVTLEVIANGSNIETFVDGTRITRATDATFRRGHLALNIPGFEIDGRPREGPKIIQFRKIEIKELPPSEPG